SPYDAAAPAALHSFPTRRSSDLLVTDRPRPAVRSARGGSVELELEGELTRRLRELAREAGGTLHQALMAGLMGLLWRYTGQRDRSEEHTSELQSLRHLVCRLLLE